MYVQLLVQSMEYASMALRNLEKGFNTEAQELFTDFMKVVEVNL